MLLPQMKEHFGGGCVLGSNARRSTEGAGGDRTAGYACHVCVCVRERHLGFPSGASGKEPVCQCRRRETGV